jgi:hypothetical protein
LNPVQKGVAMLFFLDPDTGLAPGKLTKPEHVNPKDLPVLWRAMLPGDVLLIYQHYAHEELNQWVEKKRLLIASVLEEPPSTVKHSHCSDVCFFTLNK